jgi:hypothetical protein
MDIYDSQPNKNEGSAKKKKSARPFYQGCCPKCSKPVFIPVGKGGTSSRFFSVK